MTLVLDDLHLLTAPEVLKGLEFVMRNVGPGLRLVVASRMDPLLPLHRYRLAGQLTEIRTGDLAFSVDEAGALLAQHGGMLTPDSLESLTQRTEGWAAGLRLAAISLGTHPEPDQFVKELIAEDSALIGYLVDEVLEVQPPEIRDFLLSTSILEHVSADAAVDLTGNEQAAGILMALVRTNAFVQPIGSGWYRYHNLFAEMLRLRLRYEYPDRVTALHQRAARWYERNGLLTDAVRHASRAGDWQLAAGMVIDQLAIDQILEPRDGRCRPTSSRPCRAARPGLGRSRTWCRLRLRCPLVNMTRVPPRWMPPMAYYSVSPLIRRPRAGWPPRLSGSPPLCAPGISWRRPRPPTVRSSCSAGSRVASSPGILNSPDG